MDEAEKDFLDFMHAVYVEILMDNQLYYAPLRKFHNVLDVGTGTGIWAIDFGNRPLPKYCHSTNVPHIADRYEAASVLGIDISCAQPIM